MQINCVESFERCTATVHCASSLFTSAESLHPLLYNIHMYHMYGNINIICTYKSSTLLFTFLLLEITIL